MCYGDTPQQRLDTRIRNTDLVAGTTYLVTVVKKTPVVFDVEKLWCTIQNLVTKKEHFVDITHLKPFYFDPNYVTPLNKYQNTRLCERVHRSMECEPAQHRICYTRHSDTIGYDVARRTC